MPLSFFVVLRGWLTVEASSVTIMQVKLHVPSSRTIASSSWPFHDTHRRSLPKHKTPSTLSSHSPLQNVDRTALQKHYQRDSLSGIAAPNTRTPNTGGFHSTRPAGVAVFPPFATMDSIYRPLNVSKHEIRVLKVVLMSYPTQSRRNEDIQCVLEYVSLDDKSCVRCLVLHLAKRRSGPIFRESRRR
jgi:hypothetical protein